MCSSVVPAIPAAALVEIRDRELAKNAPRRGKMARQDCACPAVLIRLTGNAEQLRELRADRQIGRLAGSQSARKSFVVEIDEMAAACHSRESAADDCGKIPVLAAIHEAVGIVGQIFYLRMIAIGTACLFRCRKRAARRLPTLSGSARFLLPA